MVAEDTKVEAWASREVFGMDGQPVWGINMHTHLFDERCTTVGKHDMAELVRKLLVHVIDPADSCREPGLIG